jgi:hypothetical protein
MKIKINREIKIALLQALKEGVLDTDKITKEEPTIDVDSIPDDVLFEISEILHNAEKRIKTP